MDPFLEPTSLIDWRHPAVAAKAHALAVPGNPEETARRCFEFVRDEIRHSSDYRCGPVTCAASDVLRHGTGYCYAKSHLLAALLRANGIPSALCYQRLSLSGDGPPYCLHGFNAVFLPETGWYRVDARGNKEGVDARWDLPREALAFTLASPEEFEFENLFAEPLEVVVECLRPVGDWQDVAERLPDVRPEEFERLGLQVRRRGGA